MLYNNFGIFGEPANTTFVDIWKNAALFVADYKASGLYAETTCRITDAQATTLYYLLYARYGNSSINSYDRNRFKYNLFTVIFEYGPTWAKRLDLQNKIRNLTDAELATGSKAIHNHAYNPGTAPSTATLDELTAINEQNTSMFKKSKLEGYTLQWEMLESDVTNTFLEKFKPLFQKVVAPVQPLWYTEHEEED